MAEANQDGTLSRADMIARRFQYHAPSPATAKIHESVSRDTEFIARKIVQTTLQSREQALALSKLEEVRMHWNQAVAFDGQGFDPAER